MIMRGDFVPFGFFGNRGIAVCSYLRRGFLEMASGQFDRYSRSICGGERMTLCNKSGERARVAPY